MARLQDFPRMAPVATELVRRKKIARSPYAVLYRVEEDRVFILRIRHDREDWQSADETP
jgi:plasmid stabilization system protein ParE